MPGIGKSIESECRLLVARGRGGVGSDCRIRTRLPFAMMETTQWPQPHNFGSVPNATDLHTFYILCYLCFTTLKFFSKKGTEIVKTQARIQEALPKVGNWNIKLKTMH